MSGLTRVLLPLLLAPVALAGCDVATPLPLTPVQIIQGAWPAESDTPVATASQRNYTIKGDTFAFPALGLSVTRASQKDWEFIPGNNSVSVKYRVPGDEPNPALTISLISIPAGTDIAASEQTDLNNLKTGGATVTTDKRTVAGVEGDQWTILQTDPNSQIDVTTIRVYLIQGQVLTLVQAQASQATFNTLKADFDKMIDSITLPKVQ
jgi:hypothetical protein